MLQQQRNCLTAAHRYRLRLDRAVRRRAHLPAGRQGQRRPSLLPNWCAWDGQTNPGFQSKQLILGAGLALGDVDMFTRLDVCIDGADE